MIDMRCGNSTYKPTQARSSVYHNNNALPSLPFPHHRHHHYNNTIVMAHTRKADPYSVTRLRTRKITQIMMVMLMLRAVSAVRMRNVKETSKGNLKLSPNFASCARRTQFCRGTLQTSRQGETHPKGSTPGTSAYGIRVLKD
jgi:hypothetical protein